jgi:aspartate-semialdehyde dehydrogenase
MDHNISAAELHEALQHNHVLFCGHTDMSEKCDAILSQRSIVCINNRSRYYLQDGVPPGIQEINRKLLKKQKTSQ